MMYKSLVYTSHAALDFDERQLVSLHRAACVLNVLDGITGLLVFNGTHFLQWIEGPPQAIDYLVERLRRDPRHTHFEICDERLADERLFVDWSMELIRVRLKYFDARDDIADRLPIDMPEPTCERILSMVQRISAPIDL